MATEHFADAVMELIMAAARMGKRRTYIRHCGLISATDAQILAQLAQAEGARMTDITRSMMTTKGASTQLIDRLIEKGYARRTTVPEDRRVVSVIITPQGRKVLSGYHRCKEKLARTLLKRIDAHSKQLPAQLMKEIASGIREYIAQANGERDE